MKVTGLLLMGFGAMGIVLALSMDTTVDTGDYSALSGHSSRVHNIGLMHERTTFLVVSSVGVVVGAIFFGFGKLAESSTNSTQSRESAVSAEIVKPVPTPPSRPWQRGDPISQYPLERVFADLTARKGWHGHPMRKYGQLARGAVVWLIRLPIAADRGLHRIVGEENDILYRFVQLTLYIVVPLLTLVVLLAWL